MNESVTAFYTYLHKVFEKFLIIGKMKRHCKIKMQNQERSLKFGDEMYKKLYLNKFYLRQSNGGSTLKKKTPNKLITT